MQDVGVDGALTPLSTYGFRVSVTNSAGIQGEWSQIISFLVHRRLRHLGDGA
jgi:hypothetical protein